MKQLSLFVAPEPAPSSAPALRWRLAMWPSPSIPGGLAWRIEAERGDLAEHRSGVGGLDAVSAEGEPAFWLGQIGASLDALPVHAERLGVSVPPRGYLLGAGRAYLQAFPDPGEPPADAWSGWSL